MRKIVFLLFAMVFASVALADEKPKQYDMVIVTLLDGRVFDIEIDADSYIYSYTKEVDEKLTQFVEVNGRSENYIFERSEMNSIRFVEALATAIEITEEVLENPMRFVDGALVFSDEMLGERYNVYDPSGKLVLSGIVRNDTPVALDKLPKGVYLAEVKMYKLKVVVR